MHPDFSRALIAARVDDLRRTRGCSCRHRVHPVVRRFGWLLIDIGLRLVVPDRASAGEGAGNLSV